MYGDVISSFFVFCWDLMGFRYSREYQVEGGVYSGKDRHNAEVAAFHLSLLLDVRRTPLAAGRRLNMSDVRAKADADLAATFSRAGKPRPCPS